MNRVSIDSVKHVYGLLEYACNLYANYNGELYLPVVDTEMFSCGYESCFEGFDLKDKSNTSFYKVVHRRTDDIICLVAAIQLPYANRVDIMYNCILSKDSVKLMLYKCVVLKDAVYFVQLRFVVDDVAKMFDVIDNSGLVTCDWLHVVRKYIMQRMYDEHIKLSDYSVED